MMLVCVMDCSANELEATMADDAKLTAAVAALKALRARSQVEEEEHEAAAVAAAAAERPQKMHRHDDKEDALLTKPAEENGATPVLDPCSISVWKNSFQSVSDSKLASGTDPL